MANNHTLKLAREDVGIAQQQVYVARSLFLPQVTAGYAYDVRDREVQMAAGNAVFPAAEKEFQRAELRVQMTIWDFGRTLGKYEQARFGKEIAGLQRKRIEQGVIYQVTKAYFDILKAKKAKSIAKEGIEQAEAHLKTAQSFFRNGVVDKNDVLRAEVQLAEVRQRLIIAENAVELATSVFNSVLGINVNHPTEVIDVTEAPKFKMTLIAALQTAIGRRPEFEIVQKSIRLEEAGITAARGEFLPRIYVAGSLNRLDDKYKRKAVETAKQVCDGIALEVKQALLGIEGASKLLAVAEKAVSQAEENLRLINSKYKQTAVTPTDVVDAETLKTRAQRNHYAALYGLIVAVERLKFAMGTIDDITDNNAAQNAKPPEIRQPTSAKALSDKEKRK
jgi:outer membrane protein TolC